MASTIEEEHIEYNDEVQKLLIQCLLSDDGLFARCRQIVYPEYWIARLRPAIRYIVNFADTYKKLPSPEMVEAETGVEVPIFNVAEYADWFLTTIERFCRHKAMEALIYDGPDLLEKGNYSELERRSKENMMISLQRELGTSYFADPLARLQRMKNRTGMKPTGWKAIDEKLYGGLNKGELTFFAGGPGCVTADTLIFVSYLDYQTNQLGKPKHVTISELSSVRLVDGVYASSPDGWVPVRECVKKEPKQILAVSTRNGFTVKASTDHLFQRKNKSWVYANDLEIGDILITQAGLSPVSDIKKLDFEEVYDLGINHPNHCYYTGGISSHNTGKSLFLQNLALNWVQQGLDVVYITLELSEDLVSLRYDAMITEVPTKQIFKDIDDIALRLGMMTKKGGSAEHWGDLQIVKMPEAGTTCNKIRAYLKEYEIHNGKKPDAILVDYLDLLHPNSGKVGPSDLFVKDKYTSEELRALACEWDVLCATASQLNRASIQEVDFDPSHIAGGISKINTADNVLGIFTSPSKKERGEYQIQFLKTRSSSGVGSRVDLKFHPESLRITDVPAGYEPQPMGLAGISQQLNQNKPQSSSVPARPSPSIPSGISKPGGGNMANASKLRDMISKMSD